jgi:siroheme synthase
VKDKSIFYAETDVDDDATVIISAHAGHGQSVLFELSQAIATITFVMGATDAIKIGRDLIAAGEAAIKDERSETYNPQPSATTTQPIAPVAKKGRPKK